MRPPTNVHREEFIGVGTAIHLLNSLWDYPHYIFQRWRNKIHVTTYNKSIPSLRQIYPSVLCVSNWVEKEQRDMNLSGYGSEFQVVKRRYVSLRVAVVISLVNLI
jgi:hypothetical protein